MWASYGGPADEQTTHEGDNGVSYSLTDSYIPSQPPINVYSTSASDSEENTNSRLSRTHSRCSMISGASSTHTIKSGMSNSSAALRRTRVRNSVTSVKSLGVPKHHPENSQSRENRDKERPLLVETVHGTNNSGVKLLSPNKKHLVPTLTRPPILSDKKPNFLAPVQPPLSDANKSDQHSMDHSFSDTLSNDSTVEPVALPILNSAFRRMSSNRSIGS